MTKKIAYLLRNWSKRNTVWKLLSAFADKLKVQSGEVYEIKLSREYTNGGGDLNAVITRINAAPPADTGVEDVDFLHVSYSLVDTWGSQDFWHEEGGEALITLDGEVIALEYDGQHAGDENFSAQFPDWARELAQEWVTARENDRANTRRERRRESLARYLERRLGTGRRVAEKGYYLDGGQ